MFGAASSPTLGRLRDFSRIWSAEQSARDRCADTTRNNLKLRNNRVAASLASTHSLADKSILVQEKHQVTFQDLGAARNSGAVNKIINFLQQAFLWNPRQYIVAVTWLASHNLVSIHGGSAADDCRGAPKRFPITADFVDLD